MLHCTSRVLQNALSDRQVILAEGIAGPQAAGKGVLQRHLTAA